MVSVSLIENEQALKEDEVSVAKTGVELNIDKINSSVRVLDRNFFILF